MISELRRPIAVKFYTVIGSVLNFIILVQNFGGASPINFLGAKNIQSLARFRSTLNFDSEYLWNG